MGSTPAASTISKAGNSPVVGTSSLICNWLEPDLPEECPQKQRRTLSTSLQNPAEPSPARGSQREER
jgi:hypothetical protein